MTAASYSVASLLLNGRHPITKKRLFFPFLDESVFEMITQNMLIGGFSVNSSMYSHHNYGFDFTHNSDKDIVSAALYCDYNSLYPSSLQVRAFFNIQQNLAITKFPSTDNITYLSTFDIRAISPGKDFVPSMPRTPHLNFNF